MNVFVISFFISAIFNERSSRAPAKRAKRAQSRSRIFCDGNQSQSQSETEDYDLYRSSLKEQERNHIQMNEILVIQKRKAENELKKSESELAEQLSKEELAKIEVETARILNEIKTETARRIAEIDIQKHQKLADMEIERAKN